ncbi:hypothetical protein BESB_017800 [Besnoitia besnoiti]|uniref:F-box domain-containing protein n=1 Tax=Besnoitia besnoiti TaxID=94643 RepID=A0A2A9MAP9_BESBE|nr:hypothetical protein BESB_017800 [Besnoitia besnoiti]PFH32462.1 hypothetical protein BESB_017800 [Besnoitia besnoiti]
MTANLQRAEGGERGGGPSCGTVAPLCAAAPASPGPSSSTSSGETPESAASALWLEDSGPCETIVFLLGFFLPVPDLCACSAVCKGWWAVLTLQHQQLWREHCLRKFGYKYENYLLYTQGWDWKLMYAKANVFVRTLREGSADDACGFLSREAFSQRLRSARALCAEEAEEEPTSVAPSRRTAMSHAPPTSAEESGLTRRRCTQLLPSSPVNYEGCLALTTDCRQLLWENGVYIQCVDLQTLREKWRTRVGCGARGPASKPCLVASRTKAICHVNKCVKGFDLATGTFVCRLKIPFAVAPDPRAESPPSSAVPARRPSEEDASGERRPADDNLQAERSGSPAFRQRHGDGNRTRRPSGERENDEESGSAEAGSLEGWEPHDFSLDVSIRNCQVTFLTSRGVCIFHSESLKCMYTIVHSELLLPSLSFATEDVDFLWAGYRPAPPAFVQDLLRFQDIQRSAYLPSRSVKRRAEKSDIGSSSVYSALASFGSCAKSVSASSSLSLPSASPFAPRRKEEICISGSGSGTGAQLCCAKDEMRADDEGGGDCLRERDVRLAEPLASTRTHSVSLETHAHNNARLGAAQTQHREACKGGEEDGPCLSVLLQSQVRGASKTLQPPGHDWPSRGHFYKESIDRCLSPVTTSLFPRLPSPFLPPSPLSSPSSLSASSCSSVSSSSPSSVSSPLPAPASSRLRAPPPPCVLSSLSPSVSSATSPSPSAAGLRGPPLIVVSSPRGAPSPRVAQALCGPRPPCRGSEGLPVHSAWAAASLETSSALAATSLSSSGGWSVAASSSTGSSPSGDGDERRKKRKKKDALQKEDACAADGHNSSSDRAREETCASEHSCCLASCSSPFSSCASIHSSSSSPFRASSPSLLSREESDRALWALGSGLPSPLLRSPLMSPPPLSSSPPLVSSASSFSPSPPSSFSPAAFALPPLSPDYSLPQAALCADANAMATAGDCRRRRKRSEHGAETLEGLWPVPAQRRSGDCRRRKGERRPRLTRPRAHLASRDDGAGGAEAEEGEGAAEEDVQRPPAGGCARRKREAEEGEKRFEFSAGGLRGMRWHAEEAKRSSLKRRKGSRRRSGGAEGALSQVHSEREGCLTARTTAEEAAEGREARGAGGGNPAMRPLETETSRAREARTEAFLAADTQARPQQLQKAALLMLFARHLQRLQLLRMRGESVQNTRPECAAPPKEEENNQDASDEEESEEPETISLDEGAQQMAISAASTQGPLDMSRHFVTWLRKKSREIKIWDILDGRLLHTIQAIPAAPATSDPTSPSSPAAASSRPVLLRVRQAQHARLPEGYFLAALDSVGIVRFFDSRSAFECAYTIDCGAGYGLYRLSLSSSFLVTMQQSALQPAASRRRAAERRRPAGGPSDGGPRPAGFALLPSLAAPAAGARAEEARGDAEDADEEAAMENADDSEADEEGGLLKVWALRMRRDSEETENACAFSASAGAACAASLRGEGANADLSQAPAGRSCACASSRRQRWAAEQGRDSCEALSGEDAEAKARRRNGEERRESPERLDERVKRESTEDSLEPAYCEDRCSPACAGRGLASFYPRGACACPCPAFASSSCSLRPSRRSCSLPSRAPSHAAHFFTASPPAELSAPAHLAHGADSSAGPETGAWLNRASSLLPGLGAPSASRTLDSRWREAGDDAQPDQARRLRWQKLEGEAGRADAGAPSASASGSRSMSRSRPPAADAQEISSSRSFGGSSSADASATAAPFTSWTSPFSQAPSGGDRPEKLTVELVGTFRAPSRAYFADLLDNQLLGIWSSSASAETARDGQRRALFAASPFLFPALSPAFSFAAAPSGGTQSLLERVRREEEARERRARAERGEEETEAERFAQTMSNQVLSDWRLFDLLSHAEQVSRARSRGLGDLPRAADAERPAGSHRSASLPSLASSASSVAFASPVSSRTAREAAPLPELACAAICSPQPSPQLLPRLSVEEKEARARALPPPCFQLDRRADVWALFDWKGLTVSESGELWIRDFCPIADVREEDRLLTRRFAHLVRRARREKAEKVAQGGT